MKRTEMTHVKEKDILEAALLGYQSQIGELQNKVREIEARLNPKPTVIELPTGTRWKGLQPKPKRTFSAETRAKMAASQKKRWRLLKRAAA